MREILFKAKEHYNSDEWLEGFYTKFKEHDYIIQDKTSNLYEVNPKTVCQYIGINDIHNEKIYENDIIRCIEEGYTPNEFIGIVVFHEGCFMIRYKKYNKFKYHKINESYKFKDMQACVTITYKYEKIGNVFDNPELLERK